MFSKKKQIALTAPGPSPWYLKNPNSAIKTTEGEWHWRFFGGPKLAGITHLISPCKETVILLDFHCYVLPLRDSQVLIWYEDKKEFTEDVTTPSSLVFTILDLSKLQPIPNPEEAAVQLRSQHQHLLCIGERVAAFEFKSNIKEGIHPFHAPPGFDRVPEVLALAEYNGEKQQTAGGENVARAVYAFRFDTKKVAVFPQKWFNEGNYDFGYQWITRVEREGETGRIIGEGIRLGTFRLDASSTRVEEWSKQDAFFHPERS